MALDTSNSWDTFLDAYSKVREANNELQLLTIEIIDELAKSKQKKFRNKYKKIMKKLKEQ